MARKRAFPLWGVPHKKKKIEHHRIGNFIPLQAKPVGEFIEIRHKKNFTHPFKSNLNPSKYFKYFKYFSKIKLNLSKLHSSKFGG